MNDITALTQRMLLDFTKPLETESGEPVKHVCHDVIEYRCARVCVDAATGIVYSSPYVGLKIRNASQYAVLRKFTEEAASAYSDFENGYISDMKCGDRSHEYLMFVKEPANVLALVEALEARGKQIADSENRVRQQNRHVCELFDENAALRQRIAQLESRTVTVKLPKSHLADINAHDEDLMQNWCSVIRCSEMISALTTAGIQVIEGEGQ
ncbi:hypothetical protein HII27_09140 [Kluyvera sp. SCKS090646]|uniref:Ead/Ea22-like family protein n=1 Tax=Kluyvera sichuanensis TaxID=2725494 RepID=A0ABR6RRY4_9ENTR|nr:hypothetical protein [Kluyvera sichuanensis]MBC1185882.1 hypothetical protein [Kluyvera sichuanensis]